jgi:hypothetical protein
MEMSGFAFTHLNEVPHMESGQRNDCGSILASGQHPETASLSKAEARFHLPRRNFALLRSWYLRDLGVSSNQNSAALMST